MRGSASNHATALAWSGCCAIARVHPFPWNACVQRVLRWCTAVPKRTPPLAAGQCNFTHARTRTDQAPEKILHHIGVDSEPPHVAPASGPPLWEDCDAQTVEGVAVEPDWDLAAQATPGFEVDQRISWVVNLVPGLVNRAFHTD